MEVTGVGWLQYWTAIDVGQHQLVLQTEERSLALGSLNYIGKITALITAIEYVCCCKDDSVNYVKMSLKSFCKILFSSFYSAKHEIEIRKWSMFFHIFSYCGSLSWNFYSDCTIFSSELSQQIKKALRIKKLCFSWLESCVFSDC